MGPDIELTEAPDACAANHQNRPVLEQQERITNTQRRLDAIRRSGADLSAMLRPPLYESAFDAGYGTVYTADYRPAEGRVAYHWPEQSWEQSFGRFDSGTRSVGLGNHP